MLLYLASYQRTRRVLLSYQEQPIYRFAWHDCASHFV
jgi:hypothetical protein